ncbi:CPBP family intramembrane metalloprotease [Puteibacter caeruleilacunae]|nr:CPBP family intramembrane metalloprotease [Puteibacter caeruleilacunae]
MNAEVLMYKPGKIQLWFEILLVFVGGPLLFYFEILDFSFLPLLLVAAVIASVILLSDKRFNFRKLFNVNGVLSELLNMFLIFIPVALIMAIMVYLFNEEYFFYLPLTKTKAWVILMFIYPVFSIIPQAILYRALFFYRYRRLVGSRTRLLILSGFLFSFGHIFFGNWVAVVLTLIGGLLFAWRYQKTGSLLLSILEHILYGCWIFTCGLGMFFFQSGSI